MEAIVLAGGFGTRLARVVTNVPKPMATVAGSPFLQFIFDALLAQGIKRIVVAVGYKSEFITSFFGEQYKDAELVYSYESTPLFTGGAIKQAMGYCYENEVCVVNGDTLFAVNLREMYRTHTEKKANITIAIKAMHNFDRYGTVLCDEKGRITAFCEKMYCAQGHINGGVYVINKSVLDSVYDVSFSFEKEILEKSLGQLDIYAFSSDGYFIDIGIPEDYNSAHNDFINMYPLRLAAFFDRDGTINANFGHVYKTEDLQFIDGMPETIKKYNDEGIVVIVVTNQAGIPKGYYTEQDMHVFHQYLNSQLAIKFGAHVDAFYFCPHHPDYTGQCACRKPNSGMILNAAKEWRIDLGNSVMYGDKETDQLAAQAAGIGRFVWVTRKSLSSI